MPQTTPSALPGRGQRPVPIPEELRHALRGLIFDELVGVESEATTLRDALVRLERDGQYALWPASNGTDYGDLLRHRITELADSADGVPEETCEWGSLAEFERLAELLGYRMLEIEVES